MREQRSHERVKEIKALRKKIENWRHSEYKGRSMPKELWDEAIRLAEEHGEREVAIGLNVSETRLKQRVREAESQSNHGSSSNENVEEEFVELSSNALFGVLEETQSVLELESGDGARLTMRFPSNQALDLVGLVRAFCRREG
jgi:hypothetical protein